MVQTEIQNAENDEKIAEVIDEKQKILGFLQEKDIDVICDDQALKQSDILSMQKHNKEFDDLLCSYVTNAKVSLQQKIRFKAWFFAVSICILIAVVIVNIILMFKVIKEEITNIEMISVLLTNFSSVLTTFIVLPKIIAEYLFNIQEETNMLEIIRNIQNRDVEIRNNLNNKK